MMISTVYYNLFVVFSSIIWFTGSVSGEFTSPALGVTLYAREFKTFEIRWKFQYDNVNDIISVKWYYRRPGASDFKLIYVTNKEGKPQLANLPANQFTNRVEFKGNLRNKDATTAIEDFLKQDEGDFKCEVNGRKPIERIVAIRVTVLANVTEFKTVAKDEIVQGDNVTLSCTTTVGKPSPKMEILRENKVLKNFMASNTSETTLLYHFGRISKESSGNYYCRVITEGYISQKYLQLKVKYPPEIDRTVKSKQFGCIGRKMIIDCTASGDPEPDVRIIGPDGNSLARNGFTLTKFGIYRCEAFSPLGNVSLNITIEQANAKPKQSSFSDCTSDKLTWQKLSDKSINYTLQMRTHAGSNEAWDDIITSTDTAYSPSANKLLSASKDYEFRVIAKNCVGETKSRVCVVKGKNPSPKGRSSDSSNAGVIAGSVIGVLVVILIIVIVAVCWRKKKRGTTSVRVKKQNQPSVDATYTKNANFKKPGGLLYSDSPNIDAPHVRPPAGYRQEDDDDDEFGDDYNNERANIPMSNNVPSWV